MTLEVTETSLSWSVVKKTGGGPEHWSYWTMEGKTVFNGIDARKALAQAYASESPEFVKLPVPERLKAHFAGQEHQYGYWPHKQWQILHATGHYAAMEHVGNPTSGHWDRDEWITVTDPAHPQFPGFWDRISGPMGKHPHEQRRNPQAK